MNFKPHDYTAGTKALEKRLEFFQRGRETKRYHTRPIEPQRVDAHSAGVALITRILVPRASHSRRATLLELALYHDLAEWRSGDMPAPAKRAMGLREIFQRYEDKEMLEYGIGLDIVSTEADRRVIKIADAAEGALYCLHHTRMGNRYALEAYLNFRDYLTNEAMLDNVPEPEEGEPALFQFINQKVSESTDKKGYWLERK